MKNLESFPEEAIEALGIMAGSLLAMFALLILFVFFAPRYSKKKEARKKERETLKSLLGLQDKEMEEFEKIRDNNPDYMGNKKK